jgi:hypothetical protein
MPSARDEEIQVQLKEVDGVDEVVVVKNSEDIASQGQIESKLLRREIP